MSMHKGLLGQSQGGSSVTPGFDRIPAAHMPSNVPQSDITLGDYIARKTRQDALNQVNQESKLTFDEWYKINWKSCKSGNFDFHDTLLLVWQAAQENK